MFGKKKKKKVGLRWEQENIYREAIKKLSEMEANPREYDNTAKVSDLIASLKMAKDRYDSTQEKKKRIESEIKELKRTGGEFAELERLMDQQEDCENLMRSLRDSEMNIQAELEALKGQNPLVDQRERVRILADQKLAWEKEHKPTARPVDRSTWVAATVAIFGMLTPAIGKELGQLWNHITYKPEQPRLFK